MKIFQDLGSPSSLGIAHVSQQASPRMQRNTREDMTILRSVFNGQLARRVLEARNLAASSGIQRREGIEKSGSEEPLQAMPLLCFSVKAKEKVWTTEIVSSPWFTMPQVSGLVLKSKWHDESESSFLKDASGKFHRPYGISELY